jgi:hypothetical protein
MMPLAATKCSVFSPDILKMMKLAAQNSIKDV